MAKLVSKTYGDALFEVAREADQIADFYEEARSEERRVGKECS